MKRIQALFLLTILLISCKPSENTTEVSNPEDVVLAKDTLKTINESPKLVVGIVVDQMRYDYLTRFWDRFGEDGFQRMINEGYNCKNNHYNYAPTKTGPGHASIFTGTSPKNHGIIANDWYDKFEKQMVYCAGDPSVTPLGTTSGAGKMSPHRMVTTTFADQNRLNTQFKGKTIGVSVKDRGAILPAGHSANGAYWFEGGKNGNFISSSYYFDELPAWVKNFNAEKRAEKYLKTWNTLYPIETYIESGIDENDYEYSFRGNTSATFPYDLKKLSKDNGITSILKNTPFGNNLTTDFAIAAVEAEQLGQDKVTDVLTLSYSCTDYVGHNFGVNSKEIEDTYLRLDQDIARLLTYLDENVGKGNYTVFLTADHGAVDVPKYLNSKKIPSGYFPMKEFEEAIKNYLGNEYGAIDLIENISNNQVFFNHESLKSRNINEKEFAENLKSFILNYEHIYKVFTREMLETGTYQNGIPALVQNGFNQKRSGDIDFEFDPAYIDYPEKGSTHGSALSYDSHVPLIFFGKGIKKGATTEQTEITDIAPTISALLGISFPNGMTGEVLYKIIDK
ncbi:MULTISPECIES: alkaline phosphatase PafA [Mesonia]|uniref:Calcium-transporting ATPase n=1 Tax=Mesonia oceanica TaxID=2687242 RepID=A0AC61Y5J3_9FLAO|nr:MULTISPECIES: alkaline phosphatase PafA [Mesonia]MAN28912.1 alkaline phosphatase [Mesonia sp.]MAQ42693.1 alkaline phosphatase [Mesonia sp.]MBJ99230.1 alkaline phosphatase [Flavobacteriaceae bacterium]VVU99771.1 Calcium-transporting ATPase [Mesonia oceanica]|tara:strand:- start:58860 stop:60551 length:1692 start_codon:yes stop_codon:yes gene_type:complete